MFDVDRGEDMSALGVMRESNVVDVDLDESAEKSGSDVIVVDLKEMSKVSVSLVTSLDNVPAEECWSFAALGS